MTTTYLSALRKRPFVLHAVVAALCKRCAHGAKFRARYVPQLEFTRQEEATI